MMVIVTGEGRKAPKTDEDRAGLLDSMSAIAGMYRLEGDKLIIKIDVALHPAEVGAELVNSFRFEGNRLQLKGDWMPNPTAAGAGRIGRVIRIWERAK
jgi:hypothetical protein